MGGAGTTAAALTRPPNTSYAGVPPLPPWTHANNPPNILRAEDVIASGRAPIYSAAESLRKEAAEDYPLAPDYERSKLHALTSSVVKSVPILGAAAIHPLAGAAVGSGVLGQQMREEAEDAGHPEAGDKMAAVGQAMGLLSALPFAKVVAGLRAGSPVIRSAVQTLTTHAGERTLEPVIARTVLKSAATSAARASGAGAAVAGAQTVGGNVAARQFGVDPQRPPLAGLPASLTSGGILGLIFGAVAGLQGFQHEQQAWQQITGAYAVEFPGDPEVRAATENYGKNRTPANLAKVIGAANRAASRLTSPELAQVIENVQRRLGIPPAPSAPAARLGPMNSAGASYSFGERGEPPNSPKNFSFEARPAPAIGGGDGAATLETSGRRSSTGYNDIDGTPGDDYLQRGSFGGKLYDRENLEALRGELAKAGITLKPDADDELNEMGMGAAFDPGTGRLLIRSNATVREVFHELGHFETWKRVGGNAERYLSLSKAQREVEVYQYWLRHPEMLNRLNGAEQAAELGNFLYWKRFLDAEKKRQ